MNWIDLNINVNKQTTGHTKTLCPKCSHTRKKKTDPCLSVDLDKKVWKCHNPGCDFKGRLSTYEKYDKVRERANVPDPEKNKFSSEMLSYFNKRKITEETLRRNYCYEEQRWMSGYRKGEKTPVFCFPIYRDHNLVNVKYRAIRTKVFMQIGQKHGSEQCFIGLNSVSDKGVIICEGEMDLMSFQEAGMSSIVSVPQGAPSPSATNFHKEFEYINEFSISILQQAKVVYLAVDDDEPGKLLQRELGRRIGRERCKVLKYPIECKDANDVLVKHGVDAVKELIDKAIPFPVEGIIRVADQNMSLDNIRKEGLQRGLRIGNKKIDRLFSVKPKLFTVVTGHSGGGKSTFVDWYLVELFKHNPDIPLHVGYYSPESRPISRQISKLAEKLVKKDAYVKSKNSMDDEEWRKAKIWLNERFTFLQPDSRAKNIVLYGEEMKKPNTLHSVLRYGKLIVEQYGANLLVIDPWNKMDHDRGRDTETDYISRACDMMIGFADLMDCHVMLVAHPTKAQKAKIRGNYERATLNDISGSGHWKNKADTGMIIHRDKYEAPKEEGKKTTYNKFAPTQVVIEKQRFEEVGAEGYTQLQMDVNQGNIFVSDYKDLKVGKGKKETEQLELKVQEEHDDKINETVSDDLPF